MDLWTALRVVARHWLVLLVGVVLTSVILAGLYISLPRQYSSTGTVIVLQPSGATNPLTTLNSSNQLAASVVVTLAGPGTSGAEVRGRGGAADYSLVTDLNLPTITITTTSSNPDVAVHTVQVVAAVMNDALIQRQRGLSAPASTWLHVVPLTPPTAATNTGGKNKILALVALLGLLVAITLAFLAEAISELRHRRSKSRERPPPTLAASRPPSLHSNRATKSAGLRRRPGSPPSFAEYLTAHQTQEGLSLQSEAREPDRSAGVPATSTKIPRHT